MAWWEIFKKRDAENIPGEIGNPDDIRTPIEDDDLPLNPYYLNVSRVYRLMQYIFLVAALLFGITSVAANPEIISYRNFLMLINNVNASEFDYKEYTRLEYQSEIPEVSVSFDGGFAVPTEESVFVYTETGRLSYVDYHDFLSPMITGGGKYFILYDFGTVNYKVCNAYSELFSGQTEYPIYSASVNRDGRYSFVCRTSAGKSTVDFYSSNFKRVGYIEQSGNAFFSKYGDGENLSVVSLKSSSGKPTTTLTVYDTANQTELKKTSYEGTLPLSFAVNGNESVLLLEDRVIFINENGEEKKLNIKSLKDFELTEKGLLLFDGEKVILYDFSGNLRFEAEYRERLLDAAFSDNAIFLLGEDRITRIMISSGEKTVKLTSGEHRKIIADSNRHITAFTKNGADLINY